MVYCHRLPYSVFHDRNARCGWCCDFCNYDAHVCGGCGIPISHGKLGCDDCMAAHWAAMESVLPGRW